MRAIFCDTETGGLDPSRNALLTVGLVVWEDGEIGDTVEFRLYADPLQCEAKALEVNRIDLAQHNAEALRPDKAAGEILRWCRARWRGPDRIRLGGHNTPFDVGFLRALYGPAYGRHFHHRPIDTMALLPFFWHARLMDADIGRLGEACEALGVPLPPEVAHTALGDAVAAAELYTRMLDMVR